jgi:hypothetical protein
MAIKRVSDLENRDFNSIKPYIDDMYNNTSKNKNKLPFSKIEVSEVIDNDTTTSLFKSYSYDIDALSGLFNDGILNRDTTFTGNKEFINNVTIKGDVNIQQNANTQSTKIKTPLFNIDT